MQYQWRLPDFMIIGAAKSGTTTLYEYLYRHPQIYLPEVKELTFFSDERVYTQGLDWYKNLFIKATSDQKIGEASTTYTRWPHTLDSAKLITETVPNVKLIYIMRHPVERSYSHYKHHMRFKVTMTFEEALAKDGIYIDCSKYMTQIKRYLEYVPDERFLFLFMSDLRQRPIDLIHQIEDYLDVERVPLLDKGLIKSNVGNNIDHYIRSKTTMKLRQQKIFQMLAHILPKKWRDYIYYAIIKDSYVGRRLKKEYYVPPMKQDTRKRLLEIFEPEISDLEKYLNVKLDHWRT